MLPSSSDFGVLKNSKNIYEFQKNTKKSLLYPIVYYTNVQINQLKSQNTFYSELHKKDKRGLSMHIFRSSNFIRFVVFV